MLVMGLYELWQQFFPPVPAFTEKDLAVGSQLGRVFIITGANSGIGLALVKLLYPTGATIYIAGRTMPKIDAAIAQAVSVSPPPTTPATLKSLHLDFRFDVLWNNAGNGCPPGTVTKQGIEAHVGANCVAPLLFTQELFPLLQATARIAPEDSVRGVDFARIAKPPTVTYEDYAASKAGNWFLALEGANRRGKYGVLSKENRLFVAFLKTLVLYAARYGAYTMLFAGFSREVNESNNGAYIWPWGRIRPIARPDVLQAANDGKATTFWKWCEDAWKDHI
ncbi:NAD(P)-binding protein [Xylaria venustula]|nr:NAD(P)-binding protein [Xylaria venustula]